MFTMARFKGDVVWAPANRGPHTKQFIFILFCSISYTDNNMTITLLVLSNTHFLNPEVLAVSRQLVTPK